MEIARRLTEFGRMLPLMVLENLTLSGMNLDIDEALQVRATEEGSQLVFSTQTGETYYQAFCTNDLVRIEALSDRATWPHDVALPLGLMGYGQRKQPVIDGGQLAVEEFERRVAAMQHMVRVQTWLRDMGLNEDQLATVATEILQLASVHRLARNSRFEAENQASTSDRMLNRLVQQEDAAIEQIRKWVSSQDSLSVTIKCLDDPRGSSLALKSKAGHDIFLNGLMIDWLPAPLAADADSGRSASPRKRSLVDVEVQEALASAVAMGNVLRLPMLDAKVYKRVDKLLNGLGGRWFAGEGVHIFEGSAEAVLQQIRGGAVQTQRDWEFFPTPPELAERMVSLAQLKPGDRALEPSSGRAAIAGPLKALLGASGVQCVEWMPANAAFLREQGFSVIEADFLTLTPRPEFDAVLINPPFAGGADIRHTRHAYEWLKPGGRLVGITSPTWCSASNSAAREFDAWLSDLGATVEEIPAGVFKASGTDVSTRLIRLVKPQPYSRANAPAIAAAPAESPAVRVLTTTNLASADQFDLFA